MITPENGIQSSGGFYAAPCTFYGLSTDTPKPTEGVANGSAFIEMDTGELYFYDSENTTWREWGGA